MTQYFICVLMVTASLTLGACASTSDVPKDAVPATPIPAQVPKFENQNPDAVFLTDIGVARLPDRKCGMILWTLDANQPVPVLRYVSGSGGLVSFNRVPFELVRVDAIGNGNFGVFERQRFAAGTNISVTVEVEFGQGFDGGVYLKRGLITVEQPEKPTLVTPVAGLAGCRS
ncbi:MAG: hypothetical protein AAFO78_07015 [Pseudomonadota bacterium]